VSREPATGPYLFIQITKFIIRDDFAIVRSFYERFAKTHNENGTQLLVHVECKLHSQLHNYLSSSVFLVFETFERISFKFSIGCLTKKLCWNFDFVSCLT
jgi:hypothetical protein